MQLPAGLTSTTNMCTVGGYQLCAGDLRHLMPSTRSADMWLDDSVLNAYGQLISTANPNVLILPEFVSRRLERERPTTVDTHEQAFLDSGCHNLLNYELVMVPVNVGGNHWTLVVMDNNKKTFYFYNSLHGSGRRTIERFRSFALFCLSRFPQLELWSTSANTKSSHGWMTFPSKRTATIVEYLY